MKYKYYLQGAGIGIIVTTIVLAIIFAITPREISDSEIIQRAEALGMVINYPDEEEGTVATITGDDTQDVKETEQPEDAKQPEEEVQPEDAKQPEEEVQPEDAEQPEENVQPEDTERSTDAEQPEDAEQQEEEVQTEDTEQPEETAQFEDTEQPDEEAQPEDTEQPEETVQPEDTQDTGTDYFEGEDVVFKVTAGEASMAVSRHLMESGIVSDAEEFNKYLCDRHIDDMIQVGTFSLQKGMTYERLAKVLTGR